MLQNLLPRIPFLSGFFKKKEVPNSSTAISNEEIISTDNSKPIYVIILPLGDHSELKKKLQKQFSEKDLRFETDRKLVDRDFKADDVYIIEVKALDKMDSEQLFKSISAQIQKAHVSLSGQSNTGRTSPNKLTRESLEELNRPRGTDHPTNTGERRLANLGVHVCGPSCNHGPTGSGMLRPPAKSAPLEFSGNLTPAGTFTGISTPSGTSAPKRTSIPIPRPSPREENPKDKLLDPSTPNEFIHKHIGEKIAASNDPNLHQLRNGKNDAKLEQSDPISQEINRELAKRADVESSMGIALTGQFSFIDRKDYHIENGTYKDFPETPML